VVADRSLQTARRAQAVQADPASGYLTREAGWIQQGGVSVGHRTTWVGSPGGAGADFTRTNFLVNALRMSDNQAMERLASRLRAPFSVVR
jgi:hypothetical protein